MFGQNLAISELTVRGGQPKYLAAFRTELTSRLRSGSHLILHGPRGSGKSTLRASMRDDYHLHCIPCAIAPQTLGLPDVVTALSQAYPKTDLGSLGRRAIGVRLRIIADRSLTDTARVLFNGSRGLGEAYMLGWREAQDLDGFIYRLLTARLDERTYLARFGRILRGAVRQSAAALARVSDRAAALRYRKRPVRTLPAAYDRFRGVDEPHRPLASQVYLSEFDDSLAASNRRGHRGALLDRRLAAHGFAL
jgi:hypothetical protein